MSLRRIIAEAVDPEVRDEIRELREAAIEAEQARVAADCERIAARVQLVAERAVLEVLLAQARDEIAALSEDAMRCSYTHATSEENTE